jgi:hypothetical protein
MMVMSAWYQHTELDLYIISSLEQKTSAGRHIASLGFRANQSLLVLVNAVCLAQKQQI